MPDGFGCFIVGVNDRKFKNEDCGNLLISSIIKIQVTVQQVCEFTALNVRKSSDYRHKSICAANFAWIYARNYEGTE